MQEGQVVQKSLVKRGRREGGGASSGGGSLIQGAFRGGLNSHRDEQSVFYVHEIGITESVSS